jgi:hypothetical protein
VKTLFHILDEEKAGYLAANNLDKLKNMDQIM